MLHVPYRSASEPTNVETPQQQNGYDCGVYATLIAKFIADQTESQSFDINFADLCSRLQHWLTPEKCLEFRERMVDVINGLNEST
jgi:Ulp1 family protease